MQNLFQLSYSSSDKKLRKAVPGEKALHRLGAQSTLAFYVLTGVMIAKVHLKSVLCECIMQK